MPDHTRLDYFSDGPLAYGITAPDPPAPYDPDAGWVSSLTPEQSAQFTADLWSASVGDLGCMYVGQMAAFGNMAIISPELNTVVEEADATVEASPKQAALNAEWAACIRSSGYLYSKPSEILDDLITRLNTLPATAQGSADMSGDGILELRKLEHRLYDADQSCRKSIGYDASAFTIRSKAERIVLDRHPSLLDYGGLPA